jgi:hypothetical protein
VSIETKKRARQKKDSYIVVEFLVDNADANEEELKRKQHHTKTRSFKHVLILIN